MDEFPAQSNEPVESAGNEGRKPRWLTKKTYETAAEKKRDFWIGVGLWFGLNIVLTLCSWGAQGLLFGLLSSTVDYNSSVDVYTLVSLIMGAIPLLVNIGLIVYFAFTRSQIALGMLAGFGIALLLVICLGVIFTAACFVILGSANY